MLAWHKMFGSKSRFLPFSQNIETFSKIWCQKWFLRLISFPKKSYNHNIIIIPQGVCLMFGFFWCTLYLRSGGVHGVSNFHFCCSRSWFRLFLNMECHNLLVASPSSGAAFFVSVSQKPTTSAYNVSFQFRLIKGVAYDPITFGFIHRNGVFDIRRKPLFFSSPL